MFILFIRWTGWDYKGEPTPYAWPDINSHFGIIDEAGFPKDRYYWYQAWFGQPSPPVLHVFPHWNWAPGQLIDVWAFSNADQVELIVNGKSLGKSSSGNYSHASWDQVPFVAGEITAKAYMNGSDTPVATQTRTTAGPAVALQASIKDGVGSNLRAVRFFFFFFSVFFSFFFFTSPSFFFTSLSLSSLPFVFGFILFLT